MNFPFSDALFPHHNIFCHKERALYGKQGKNVTFSIVNVTFLNVIFELSQHFSD